LNPQALALAIEWLQAAANIFDLIYTAQDGAGALSIKPEASRMI
jgi:hypothetical protein